MPTFDIHDNGGRPFRVRVTGRKGHREVRVYVRTQSGAFDRARPKFVWTHTSVWIGKSPLTPMTSFSGGHGSEFDGNTILVDLQNETGDYVFIGSEIYRFRPLAPVVKYVSEVGNSDVPYPYGVDAQGNYYLMIENTVLLHGKYAHIDPHEPYMRFYENNNRTRIIGANGRRKTVAYYSDIRWHVRNFTVSKKRSVVDEQRKVRKALGLRFIPHKKILHKRVW